MNSSQTKYLDYFWLPQNWIFVLGILTSIVATIYIGASIPQILSQIYLHFNDSEFSGNIQKLLLLFIAEYLSRVIYQYSLNRYVTDLLINVRSFSYSRFMKAVTDDSKDSDKGKFTLGEVLARLVNDSAAIMELVSSGSFAIFIDLLFIVSCLLSFLSIDLTLGLYLISIEVLFCFFFVYLSSKMSVIFNEVRVAIGKVSKTLADIIGLLNEQYFFGPNRYAAVKGEKSFDEFLSKQLKSNIWDAGYYSLAESLFPIILTLLALLVPYAGVKSLFIIAVFIDLISRSISPIKEISGKISSITRARVGIIRIKEFNDFLLNKNMVMLTKNENMPIKSFELNIQTFTFENGPKNQSSPFTLGPIHFHFHGPGLFGLIGKSGMGKSTILKILSGSIIDVKGSVKIHFEQGEADEINLGSIESSLKLQRYFCLLSQESHLFKQSLAFNIHLDRHPELFENFYQRVTTAIPIIKKWFDDPSEIINTKNLSLGQKQMIAALRALYLPHRILLVDEISSGLDSEIELALRSLINLFQQESLLLMVTHRIETIKDSKQIIIVDHGKFQVSGKHQELLLDQNYRNFVSLSSFGS